MVDATQITLITGAGKGIGLACAHRLAAAGHRVVGLALSPPPPAFPGHFHQVDLGDRAATERLLAELCARHRFTGLLNNVGRVDPQPLGAVELDTFDKVIGLNMVTALQCAQACLPAMREQRHGRIVSIASEVVLGLVKRTAYAAAKAGLMSFTRTWALELARDGITVNAVAPGPVDTDLFAVNNPPGSAERQRKIDRTPVGRLGQPEDIANAVAFFMSPHSSYITGQTLFVCGGSSLGSSEFF